MKDAVCPTLIWNGGERVGFYSRVMQRERTSNPTRLPQRFPRRVGTAWLT